MAMGKKIIFFDTGPIISLVMSRLAWILPLLKQKCNGTFYITPAVKRELVERPMTIHRFEFEALESLKLINDGVLQVYNQVPRQTASELITLANSSFSIGGKTIDIIQSGEIESIASARQEKADAIVMDERTLRLFIENSAEMEKLLELRFKRDVVPDSQRINQFSSQLKGIPIIRSIELVGTAYRFGLLNDYARQVKNGNQIVLDSVLWATKFNGCAVTEHEIEEIKQFLLKG